jgi:hypothetical protein
MVTKIRNRRLPGVIGKGSKLWTLQHVDKEGKNINLINKEYNLTSTEMVPFCSPCYILELFVMIELGYIYRVE